MARSTSLMGRLYQAAFQTKQLLQRPAEEQLQRKFEKLDLTLLGVGASIGAGIFVLTGIAAKMAGPAVCFSFLIAAGMCMLNAFAYAELSSRYPESGSAYLYSYIVFGEIVAIIAGVNLLIDYHVGAASIARSLVSYFGQLCRDIGVNIPEVLISTPLKGVPFISLSILAPLVLLLITLVLVRGVSESTTVSNALTALKVCIVLLVIVAGMTVANSKNLHPFAPKGSSGVVQASAYVFFAYIGFDAVSNTAEECVSPKKDLPFGIVVSLLLCAILYMGVTLTLCGVVKYSSIDENAPLTTAFKGHGMHWIELVIDLGAVVGLSTTLLVGLYSQSRIYLGIARDKLLPRRLALVDPKSGTPYMAQVLCFLIAGVLSAFFDVRRLSSVLSIGIMFAYTIVCAAVLKLRVETVERKALSTYLLFLVLFSAGAGFSYKYGGSSLPVLLGIFSFLTILVLIMIRVSLTFHMPADSSTYACPWVPILPALGMAFNVFQMCQLSYLAWIRLGLVTFLSFVGYAYNLYSGGYKSDAENDVENADAADDDIRSPLLATNDKNGSLN